MSTSINDVINRKVDIFESRAEDLNIYPISFLFDVIGNFQRWENLMYSDDDVFVATCEFLTGEKYNESHVSNFLYQYECRKVKDMTLQDVYKFENKSFFQKVLSNQNYFNIESKNK